MLKELHAADAEAHYWITELGVITRNDNVTRPDKHESASDTPALYGGDGRLWHITPPFAKADVDFLFASHLRLGASARKPAPSANGSEFGHLLIRVLFTQIMPSRKMWTIGGKNNDFDGVVLGSKIKSVVQFIQQACVLRVASLWPVQYNPRDMLGGGFVQYGLEFLHNASLF